MPPFFVWSEGGHLLIEVVDIWFEDICFNEVPVTIHHVGDHEQNVIMEGTVLRVKNSVLNKGLIDSSDDPGGNKHQQHVPVTFVEGESSHVPSSHPRKQSI